jgi:glycosyltransferase involved in cell wall biosynthesis
MMFSVVIPTYNRSDLLCNCLDRLTHNLQQLGNTDYEVIVTDDGNDGITEKIIKERYDWVKWVAGPRRGPAANRNNGARVASGSWLVFIDDDVLPYPALLRNYKEGILKNEECEAFEGAIFPDNVDLLKIDMAECPVNTDGGHFWSANICIKKSLFEKINGFDEDYLMAAQEDQQIKIDIESIAGKQIIFLKNCAVVHPVRFSNVVKQIKRIPMASKNFIIYVNKNKGLLGYGSIASFGTGQFTFHLKTAWGFIKEKKFKNFVVSAMWLVYGVPLNIVNLYRVRKN